MTAGLIRSETVGDMRITVGALGLLGALLGTAVAYVATATFFRSQLSQRMSHAPVLDLILTLVGLPLAAAARGWLFAGREPVAIAHQPFE
jgi:putative ABC transport system permease protein